jgi:hypothetical protein
MLTYAVSLSLSLSFSLSLSLSVDAKHLSGEYAEMAHGAAPAALRLWLMAGRLVIRCYNY